MNTTILPKTPNDYKGEIYVITCSINGKQYVGQTRTHYLNQGKYRPYGSVKRFKDHISEATSNIKKNQCRKLNNAIRKYGADKFSVEIIYICDVRFLNHFERVYISVYDTFNHGYNLNSGGNQKMSDVMKINMINKIKEMHSNPVTKEIINKKTRNMLDIRTIQALQKIEANNFNLLKSKEKIKLIAKDNQDEFQYSTNLSGYGATDNVAYMRCKYILNNLGYEYALQISNDIDRDAYNNIEVDSNVCCKPEAPNMTVRHPRVKSYEEKDEKARLDRYINSTIESMSFSIRNVKGYKVIYLDIYAPNKSQCTFGGKHHDLDYYAEKCLKFMGNLMKSNKFDKYKIEYAQSYETYVDNCAYNSAIYKLYSYKW